VVRKTRNEVGDRKWRERGGGGTGGGKYAEKGRRGIGGGRQVKEWGGGGERGQVRAGARGAN